MKKNLAKVLLETFDELEESIKLYKKVERTYDMPVILDTTVRENVNKIYALTLEAIKEVLLKREVEFDKYDINQILIKGKEEEILTEKNYELLKSNFVQFNDLNLHQQHSVNFLIDWYKGNKEEIEQFKLYIKEVWLQQLF